MTSDWRLDNNLNPEALLSFEQLGSKKPTFRIDCSCNLMTAPYTLLYCLTVKPVADVAQW